MRFAGGFVALALVAGGTASAQDDASREQRMAELQKQLDAMAAELRALKAENAKQGSLDERLDEAIRESPPEPLREPRRLNISAPGLEGLDITGGLHARGEYWGNHETPAGGNGDSTAFGMEAWLGFNARISEKSNIYIEPQTSFVWGDDTTHSFSSPTGSSSTINSDDIHIVQAYLRVVDLYGYGWDMTAGRQAIELGAERMLGDDEWYLSRTTYDGFRFDHDLGDPGNISLLAIRLEDVVHSVAGLTPTIPGQDARGDLFGLYYSSKTNESSGQFDLYVLHLEDPNYGSGTPSDETRWTTYGGRYVTPSFGGLTFDVEAATQFGEFGGLKTGNHDWGFDVWAMHAGACFAPETDVQVFDSFCVGYDYATGSDNTNEQHSFVQLYPSTHSWFGLTDYFSWTNIIHWMAGVNLEMPHGTLALSYHWNRMASSDGGFIGPNQAGGPSNDGKDLGEEFDIVWVIPCTQTTQVDLGMGFFMPGDGFEASTGGDDNVVFGYLQFRTGF